MANLTVAGTVFYPNGQPVKAAEVRIYEVGLPDDPILTTTTNASGQFNATTTEWGGNPLISLTFIIKQDGQTVNGPYFRNTPIFVTWFPPGAKVPDIPSVLDDVIPPLPELSIDNSLLLTILAQLFPEGVLHAVNGGDADDPSRFGDISATIEWIGLQHTIPIVPIVLGRNNEVEIDVAESINDKNGCCSDEGIKAGIDWIGTQHTLPIVPIIIGESNKVTIKAPHHMDTARDMSSKNEQKTHGR